MIKKSNKGYVILIGVIIIGAVTLVISIGAMTRTISMTIADTGRQISTQEKNLAESCVEVALMNMQKVLQYSGNEDIMVGTDICHIGSVVRGVDQVTIHTQGVHNKYEWEIEVITQNDGLALSVKDWTDVISD